MRLIIWTLQKMRHNPDSLLHLLIAARNAESQRRDIGLWFRAGLRIGRAYPEVADKILEEENAKEA